MSAEVFTKCSCNVCSNYIEFDASHAGDSINCPHCGMETLLYAPTPPRPHEPLKQAPSLKKDLKCADCGELLSSEAKVCSHCGKTIEQTFFAEQGILITHTRVVIAGRVFALAGVNYANQVVIPPPERAWLIIVGFLVAMVVLGVTDASTVPIIVAIATVIASTAAACLLNTNYALALNCAGQEIQFPCGTDPDLSYRAFQALQKAIISRG